MVALNRFSSLPREASNSSEIPPSLVNTVRGSVQPHWITAQLSINRLLPKESRKVIPNQTCWDSIELRLIWEVAQSNTFASDQFWDVQSIAILNGTPELPKYTLFEDVSRKDKGLFTVRITTVLYSRRANPHHAMVSPQFKLIYFMTDEVPAAINNNARTVRSGS